jgi:hypothetical protein
MAKLQQGTLPAIPPAAAAGTGKPINRVTAFVLSDTRKEVGCTLLMLPAAVQCDVWVKYAVYLVLIEQ